MARPRSPVNVVGRIEQLLRERQEHHDALTRINEMLERVGDALGAKPPARPRGGNNSSVTETPARTRRRRRRKFAVSAAESVLAFVKERKNPTTQEVKKHWLSEGRKGTADNALTLLVKDKKLKRTPLEGQRGSRYSLA
jgi:ferric-dicitrate binding protein FerR (iron transport regulator)